MTTSDFATMLEKEQLREKLVNRVRGLYPQYRNLAEEWADEAIMYGLNRAATLENEVVATSLLADKVIFVAIDAINEMLAQRNALQGKPKATPQRDPMRRVDFKVDLEKAIKLTTGHRTMQQALWHLHFEKWTWDEVIEVLPKDVNEEAWRKRIMRTNEDLQRRLRAYGYRG